MLLRSTKEWDVYHDDASGKEYYLNKMSGATTWDQPVDLEPPERARSATDLRPPPVGRAINRGPPPRPTLQRGDFEKAQSAQPLSIPSPTSSRKSVESRAASMRAPLPDSDRKLAGPSQSQARIVSPMSPTPSQARLNPMSPSKSALLVEDAPINQAALWLQTLTPEDQEDQPAFLATCLHGLDAVVDAIAIRAGTGVAGGKCGSAGGRGPVDSHPLANTILQSVLLTRELLNCWSSGAIHDVAIDSLTHRLAAIQHTVNHHRTHWPKTEGPKLSKLNQRQQWQERKPYIQINSFALKEDQILDLNLVDECHELQTGASSEFKVTIRSEKGKPEVKAPSDKKDKEGREYHFRTDTDAQKQWWLARFRLWGQHNKINGTLNAMSTTAQARVYGNLIFRKRSEQNEGYQSALREFVFATTTENASENVASDFRQARLQALGSSIKERFKVFWPQKMAKDKKREIEIDLSRPHRFLVYKPSKSGVIEETPSASFTRFDLIGYKIEGSCLEVLFDPRKNNQTEGAAKKDVEEFRRKFVLESAQSLGRLKDLLQMFVQPSVEETPTLIYQDVLSTLHRIDMRTADDGKFSFGSQLHSVFEELTKLGPGNMHCIELERKSSSLPLSMAGDLERVKMLVRKIYAVEFDIDHKHLAVACMCHETQKRCLLMLYRCLLKAQALGDLTHYIRETESPELKAWLLRAIWGILGCAAKAVKCMGECGSNEAGFDLPMQPLLYYVDQASNKHAIEPTFINVLFEILLNEVDFSDSHKPINMMGKEVVEHDVIPVILHALTHSTLAACDEGLKGFVLLVKSPANNAVFISQSGWQSWIFPLVALYYRSSWSAGQETEKNIFNMGLLLLTNLQFATLMTAQKEHDEARHALLVSLDKLRSSRGWNHNTVMLARMFLGAVVTQIKNNARDFTNNFEVEGSGFERLWGVLYAVVEFLFFLPLAQKNAQVDKLGSNGQTTLMLEAHKGNLAAVKHLIEVLGADAGLTDREGRTALDLALASKHIEVVEFLKTPRDARQASYDTIHFDENGDCLDLELVQKVVATLKACNLHNLKSFDATGEKKTKTFVEFEKEATLWWDFFMVCDRAFTDINAASSALSKMLDSRQSSGLIKTGTHSDTILSTLSTKLFEVQKTLKHGHSKHDCDLVKGRP